MKFGLRDFFMGIVHLFVIFLPGSAVLVTILYLAPGLQNFDPNLNMSDIGATLLFVGISYFLGHLVSLTASAIEDVVSTGPRKGELGLDHFILRRVANDICVRMLGREVISPKNLRRWSALIVRHEGGVLQDSVESKDADRRFFRNIRLVLLLPLLAMIWRVSETSLEETGYVVAAVGLILLTILAHFRYVNQDEKFTQLVFESLIAIDAANPKVRGETSAITHAGGIIFRRIKGNIEYLLVRPKKNDNQWVLPKGHIEEGETVEEAAIREVQEETGATVEICAFLKFMHFFAGNEPIRLAIFLMRAVKPWGESPEGRESKWCGYDEACRKISFPESLSVLKQANNFAVRCQA